MIGDTGRQYTDAAVRAHVTLLPAQRRVFGHARAAIAPKSGGRAGYSGATRRRGSKAHTAVDTQGRQLALTITPASEDERTQVAALAAQVQAVTGEHVEIAYVDQGYTGPEPAARANTASSWSSSRP